MWINGEYWEIVFCSPNHPILNGTLGCCDDNLKTIFIVDGLSDFMLQKVLSHEITHAAMFSYNVFLDLDQEEMVADLIAVYGREILCNAKRVFREIKKLGTPY